MIELVAISRDKQGTEKSAPLRMVEYEGVSAIYADSVKCSAFDPEEAISVKIGLGDDVTDILAIAEESPYWTKPHFVNEWDKVPERTNCILCKKDTGTFTVILPVVGKEYKTALYGKDNSLYSRTFSWCEGSDFCEELLFVFAEGKNPFELLSDCFKAATKLLGNRCRLREERNYPEFLEYLGWCSWDSMQIRVSEDGLKEKCEEFKEKNIPVKWAIIDDMWAEIRDFYGKEYSDFAEMVDLMHSSKLYSFEADPLRFPNGLKHAVEMINSYGIEVGMWYPVTGYWSGIAPEGDAYKQLEDYLIKTEEDKIVPDYNAPNAYMYFKTIFDFFRKCGVEFVKIDNQAMPRVHYKGMAPIGKTAAGIGSGIEAAVGEAFDGKLINCMGMSAESMWNRSSTAVSRCSNDFMPENRKWFRKHILQCTYNGLTQGQLYHNDFDMWWTDDEQAKKNSLLRAVSGGPIYVSDKIGRSNPEIFKPLVLEDGRILRCERPGVPTMDCLLQNPGRSGKIFKVQNIVNGSGVIAAFNLSIEENERVSGTVSPCDVEGLTDGEYVIYEHFSKEYQIVKYDEYVEVSLENADEMKLFLIIPLVDDFCVIGRTDKFISPATVEYASLDKIVLKENGPYAYVAERKLLFVDNE